jgi:hypothetical protein
VVGVFIPADTLREWLIADPSRYIGIARVLSEWNERAIVALRTRRCKGPRRSSEAPRPGNRSSI